MSISFIDRIRGFLTKGHPKSILAKQNIIFSLGVKSVSIIVGILFIPLLINYLDQERYGIWLTISSILLWFSFFDIGLGHGLRNELVKSLAKDDLKTGNILVSTTYVILAMVFCSLLVVFLFANRFIPWELVLNTKVVSRNELYILTSTVFSIFILRFIFQLIVNILFALQKSGMANSVNPFGNALAFIVISLLVVFNVPGNLLHLAVILSVSPVLVQVGYTIYIFSQHKYLRPRFSKVEFSYLRPLFGLGYKFFVIQVATIIIFSTSNFIISNILGPKHVTIYTIAHSYFRLPIMAYSIVMAPIWSLVTSAYAQGDFTWLKRMLIIFSFVSALLIVLITAMLLVSPSVYRIWIGPEIEIPFSLSLSMAIYSGVIIVLTPYTNYINGFGKLQLSNNIIYVSVVLFLVLAVMLTLQLHSAEGVVIASTAVNALGLYFQPRQVMMILNGREYGVWAK